MQSAKYVIVQAGGSGTRLGHLTANRPKCLVPVQGRPLLYWLSDAFPMAHFIIIADYRRDVLEAYLKTVEPPFSWELVTTDGTGTCAGVEAARDRLPSGARFALVWSDLLFDGPVDFEDERANVVLVSDQLPCRWTMVDGRLEERPGTSQGIIGCFLFGNPTALPPVPESGEFVRFARDAGVQLASVTCRSVREAGTLDALASIEDGQPTSRFFNEVRIEGNTVTKRARFPKYQGLLNDEASWYRFVSAAGYTAIPHVLSFEPLTLERVDGLHPFDLPKETIIADKVKAVDSILNALEELHTLGSVERNDDTIREVYVTKTKRRMEQIAPLLPKPGVREYVINGHRVPNLLHPAYESAIDEAVSSMGTDSLFTVLHGDPTFSNLMLRRADGKPVLFDPRGYFGKSKILGDPLYDIAKLYYSVVGNYDQFNRRHFRLDIADDHIDLAMVSQGWEVCEPVFEERYPNAMDDIRVLHALIWLALAGYVLDDVDSIVGAYMRGLDLFWKAVA